MTATDLAREWGCSRQAVAKWVAKGMPLNSLAEATAWRSVNGQRAPRVQLAAAVSAYSATHPDRPSMEPIEPGEDPGVAEYRRHSDAAARFVWACVKELIEASEAKDPMRMRGAFSVLPKLQDNAIKRHNDYERARTAAGFVMPRSTHVEAMDRVFREMRAGLDDLMRTAPPRLEMLKTEEVNEWITEYCTRLMARMIHGT